MEKGKGLVPNEREENEKFEVAAFKIIRASISSYKKNLNTHASYKEFREMRANQRKTLNRVNGLELANIYTIIQKSARSMLKDYKK